MSKSSIWPIDRILSGAKVPGHSGRGSNVNEEILHISQSSRAKPSPSGYLVSYPGHLLVESYPSAEMQMVYSAAPANWAREKLEKLGSTWLAHWSSW